MFVTPASDLLRGGESGPTLAPSPVERNGRYDAAGGGPVRRLATPFPFLLHPLTRRA